MVRGDRPSVAIDAASASQRLDHRKNLKREAIRETMEVWQPRYARGLSEEDAREILENAVGFFRILREWKAAERRAERR